MSTALALKIDGISGTERLGESIAAAVPDGTTIGFIGTLGAGKTRLIQAIARSCGLPAGSVTSPTFVLCQVYQGRRTLYHIDAYRLHDVDEFLEIGVEEMFESSSLVLVEWADRVEDALPRERITIRLEVTGSEKRLARIEATACYQSVLSEISRLWADDLS